MAILFLLTCIAYTVGASILSLLILFWYIRPFRVSTDVPGPKRHWLLGVGFGDGDEFTESSSTTTTKNDTSPEVFDWGHWPTLSLTISRRHNFRTWGGPTLNIGFGGAFFNVGKSK